MHDKIKLQSDSIILTVNGVEISKSCDLAQHVNLENGGVARTSQNGLLLHARHREVDAHLSLWAFKRLVQSGLRPQKWAELIMLLQELLPTKSFLQSNTKVSNQDWIAETVEGQKRFEIFAG